MDYGRLQVGRGAQGSFGQSLLVRLVQVDHHDRTSLHGDPEQGDVAHPHTHAKFVAQRPLQQEAAGHGVQGGKMEKSAQLPPVMTSKTRYSSTTLVLCKMPPPSISAVGDFCGDPGASCVWRASHST